MSPAHAKLIDLPARRARKSPSAEGIAEALVTAIVEHRLAPGTQLKERALGEIFGVSRTLIREALIQLGRMKVVTMRQSAGAFVATPTVEEAHQVFAVRRMVELQWLREWVPRSTPAEVKRLRAHLLEERDALKRSDVARRTRLLGDFHVEIARISANTVLVDLTRELVTRSSLILLVYQSWQSAQHSSDEHKGLVDAIGEEALRGRVDGLRGDTRGRGRRSPARRPHRRSASRRPAHARADLVP